MSARGDDAILTLEPLIDAIRGGVESAGWELSGLQKTTSHQFEGRWEGESTRSAYLFFHSDEAPGAASIDVYLDETSRGLTGNLALVVDLVPFEELGDAGAALRVLGGLSEAELPSTSRTPLTLRLRLKDGGAPPGQAESEVRFKLRLPKDVFGKGPAAIRTLARATIASFQAILSSPELVRYLAHD